MNRTRWSPHKDTQALCVEAARAGWRIEKTGSGHLLFTAPSGVFCSASSTPSDWRAVHKDVAPTDWEACARIAARFDADWPAPHPSCVYTTGGRTFFVYRTRAGGMAVRVDRP